jgi:transcriptional regulator with XRE-family HTH domain
MNDIGLRIKELRKQHAFTQLDVAIHIGIKRVSVSKWESQGELATAPKGRNLLELCKFLKTTPEYLIYGDSSIDGLKDVMDGSIGVRIYNLRVVNGLSQNSLAKLLCIKQPNISDWESDITSPSGENLIKLCGFLKTTPEFVLYGKENKLSIDDAANYKLLIGLSKSLYSNVMDNSKNIPGLSYEILAELGYLLSRLNKSL